jgi:hypothetical protein
MFFIKFAMNLLLTLILSYMHLQYGFTLQHPDPRGHAPTLRQGLALLMSGLRGTLDFRGMRAPLIIDFLKKKIL